MLRPRRNAAFWLVAFGSLTVGLACEPEIPEGVLVCAEDSECPAEWICHSDARCYTDEPPGPVCERAPKIADVRAGLATGPLDLDLLFVIDNSGSMTEEQASLAAEIPRLFNVLLTGEDGEETFRAFESLHVAVITTDMGTGPDGACGSMFGDDGVFLSMGNVARPSCMATYPDWLGFAADTDDPSAFATDVQCVASAVGTDGCGYEQQLDAILKALTPSTSEITFQGGTLGHGDGQNAGFLREDSLLAIILLTDEDDCSVIDPDLFEMDNPRYDPNLNLRCFLHPEAVQPVSRYTDGLLALRADNPDRLVYATITGIPVELVPDSEMPLAPQVESILADPRMIERPSPVDSTQLVPSCDIPGRGRAFPPRRLIQLAADLEKRGANGVVQSICQGDYSGALDAILQPVVTNPCIEFPSGSRGLVPSLQLIMPAQEGQSCEDEELELAWVEEDGEVCEVPQLTFVGGVPSPGNGWYLDGSSDDAARCGEDRGLIQTVGVTLRRGSFLQELASEEGSIGEDCRLDSDDCDTSDRSLACDPASFTCQLQCSSSSGCGGGFVCAGLDEARVGVCSNPTCS